MYFSRRISMSQFPKDGRQKLVAAMLSSSQTSLGRDLDNDMPTVPDLESVHAAKLANAGLSPKRNIMSVSSRMFSAGGRENGIRDHKVSPARYGIKTGTFETPVRIVGATQDLIDAIKLGLVTCPNIQCGRPMIDRGGRNFYCPNCGEAVPSM
jgi:hypothetical protein